MSTQPLFSPITEEELAAEIRQYAPKLRIYQGGDGFFTFEKAGRQWVMPPDLGPGKKIQHPDSKQVFDANGECQLSDVYGRLQDPLRRRFTGAMGVEPGNDAISIMRYVMTQYGERGVVWLRGDGRDEKRKEAARTLFRNYKRGWAEGQMAARAKTIEHFEKNPTNAGKAMPRPTSEQRRAQKLLDSLADEGRGLYEFVCEHGCSDFEEFADYARHMKVNHGKTVAPPSHNRPEDDEPDGEAPEPLVGIEDLDEPNGQAAAGALEASPVVLAALERANNLAETQAGQIAQLEVQLAELRARNAPAETAPAGGKGRGKKA